MALNKTKNFATTVYKINSGMIFQRKNSFHKNDSGTIFYKNNLATISTRIMLQFFTQITLVHYHKIFTGITLVNIL